MTSDELFPASVTSCAADVGAADNLCLLRRYEPVLRLTRGELFLPSTLASRAEDLTRAVLQEPLPSR